jgi:signal transduction histidine kinase
MSSFFDMGSLRGKITSAYIVLVAGTVALGVIAFLDLIFLERQVTEGEVVSALKDAVLEMRREEKNLFLYADDAARSRAEEYATASLDILQKYSATLDAIDLDSKLSPTIEALRRYRTRLARWQGASSSERERLSDGIRALGHKVYRSIDLLASQERRMLEAAVQKSQRYLLVFLLIVGLAIYIVGRQLKHLVVTPLKQLESRLISIADGRLDRLEPPSRDREFLKFTDVFNRMLKELEIRQRRMLQSEKLASLGILSSGVAHELNNPLSNISSSCQLLMEELEEAETEQLNIWLKQIDAETERGRKIVRTLLDFGSQRVFQRSRIKLSDLIGETQTILGKTLRQSSVRLTVDIPAGLVLTVDKQRIQQLFINLIQNALHAAGEGVHVRVSARVCEAGIPALPSGAEVAGNLKCINDNSGRVVEILVADDGPGIPFENLSKVFDPFFTTSEPGKGVGLGLFIVQEIVREHDGCLAIVSRPGKGTQVIVLLSGEDSDHG